VSAAAVVICTSRDGKIMKHSGAGHLKGMALIAGGAFVVLLLLGKPAGEAFSYALALACPLMMVGMMFGGHGGHGGTEDNAGHDGHAGHGGTREPTPDLDTRPAVQGDARITDVPARTQRSEGHHHH
jgi:hypothetical protein